MKSQLIQRVVDSTSSLAFQDYSSGNFLKVWHYHPELELNVILEGTGTAFVGDSVERFEPGDVVLIGKNLPHLWLNDEIYFSKGSRLLARAQIIHFFENFGGGFLQMPEMSDLNSLIERAKLGLKFQVGINSRVVEQFRKISQSSGYERLINFIQSLKLLSAEKNYKVLSSSGFAGLQVETNKDRLLPVYEYVLHNFRKEITLEKAATLANMNASSFSRYFTKIHNKTFTQFLIEIRIGCACKLLLETKYIAGACYDSGFNNISNFNRQFKEIKKITPSDYIRLHSFA